MQILWYPVSLKKKACHAQLLTWHGFAGDAGKAAFIDALPHKTEPQRCPNECFEGLERLIAGNLDSDRHSTVMALLLGVGSGFILGFLTALVTLYTILGRAGNGWGGAGAGGLLGHSLAGTSSLPCSSPPRSALISDGQAMSPNSLDSFSAHVRKSIRAAQKLDKF